MKKLALYAMIASLAFVGFACGSDTTSSNDELEGSISLSKSNLDFGEVYVGDVAEEDFNVVNLTNLDILNLEIESSNSSFKLSTDSVSIQSGDTAKIVVSFEPLKEDSYSGSINISSEEHGINKELNIFAEAVDKILVLVLNEGAFQNANASVSSWDPQDENTAFNLFRKENGRMLGDILQSGLVLNDEVYLVVNNSQKIEVTDTENLTSKRTINLPDSSSPRYMVIDENKGRAYVTNLYSNNIYAFDAENPQSFDVIRTGSNPEGIAMADNQLYVANSGFGYGNTVSVISLATEEVTNTIQVGDNPGLVREKDGLIWVLSVGSYGSDFNSPDDDTNGGIYVIDPSTNQVIKSVELEGHPGDFDINLSDNYLYVINDGVKMFDVSGTDITYMKTIAEGRFYGLDFIDELNMLFTSSAPTFSQEGYADRYTAEGEPISTFTTGIGPNGFLYID